MSLRLSTTFFHLFSSPASGALLPATACLYYQTYPSLSTAFLFFLLLFFLISLFLFYTPPAYLIYPLHTLTCRPLHKYLTALPLFLKQRSVSLLRWSWSCHVPAICNADIQIMIVRRSVIAQAQSTFQQVKHFIHVTLLTSAKIASISRICRPVHSNSYNVVWSSFWYVCRHIYIGWFKWIYSDMKHHLTPLTSKKSTLYTQKFINT